MKNLLKNFLSAAVAGIAISIGCIVFLSVENKIIGSILFTLGLFTILTCKLNLFTGKAPYLLKINKLEYYLFVFITWLGNFFGTWLTARLISFTRIHNKLIENCIILSTAKIADNHMSLFILGALCGGLMYIAVDIFNFSATSKNFSATITTALCVIVFILAGFEHSIADMFYFTLTLSIEEWIIPLLIITFGNVVGGNVLCLAINYIKRS